MIKIELPDTVLRGQTLKGSVHFSSTSPKTAKEVTIIVFNKIRLLGKRSYRYIPEPFVKPLFNNKNVEISTGTRIDIAYTIPEDALWTFDNGVTKIRWYISGVVQYGVRFWSPQDIPVVLPLLLDLAPNVEIKEFVVLPHVLKSESSPDKVFIPVCKHYSDSSASYRPFHLWRYTGPLHKSSHVEIVLKRYTLDQYLNIPEKDHYYPGDSISGALYFGEPFSNCDLDIYLVFLTKPKTLDKTEEEHLITHTHGTFNRGSSFPFSFAIPETAYPTFKTNYLEMWWVVRVVISNPFRFTKVIEKEIIIDPLMV